MWLHGFCAKEMALFKTVARCALDRKCKGPAMCFS